MYKNILVVINPDTEKQPALVRAINIAKQQPIVKITALVTIYDFSYDMTSILSPDARKAMRLGMLRQKQAWLTKICQPYLDQKFNIEIKARWYNHTFEAVLKYAYKRHVDLIIKATRDHNLLESMIFTPTDWHLLRKSACPVLLVDDKPIPLHTNIIAAVDLTSDDENGLKFNHKIIQEAQKVATILQGTLNIVNAYPATPSNINVELPEFDPISYTEAIKKHHLSVMKELRETFNIPKERTFVKVGQAEHVIPDLAKEMDAQVVVMGTQGRTGLSATFIGNTAESTIDKLHCDLFALKPDGFISVYHKD